MLLFLVGLGPGLEDRATKVTLRSQLPIGTNELPRPAPPGFRFLRRPRQRQKGLSLGIPAAVAGPRAGRDQI